MRVPSPGHPQAGGPLSGATISSSNFRASRTEGQGGRYSARRLESPFKLPRALRAPLAGWPPRQRCSLPLSVLDSESESAPPVARHWPAHEHASAHSCCQPSERPGEMAGRRRLEAPAGRRGQTSRLCQARALGPARPANSGPLSVAEQAPPEATRLQVSTLRAQACWA